MSRFIATACASIVLVVSAPASAVTLVYDASVTNTVSAATYPALGSAATVSLTFDTSTDPDLMAIDGTSAGKLSDYVFDSSNRLVLATGSTPPGDRLTPADILFSSRASLQRAVGSPVIVDFKTRFSVTFLGGTATGFANPLEFSNLPRINDAGGGALRSTYESGSTTAGTGVVFVASSQIQSAAYAASNPAIFTLADFFALATSPGFANFVSLNIDTNAANVGGPSIAQLNFGPAVVPLPGAAVMFLAGLPLLLRRKP